MTTAERDLWFAKAHRLEEDRLTLLRLLSTFSETRLRLNGTAGGLVESPEYLSIERRIMRELTTLNERQNGYIAEMMAFEPERDSESGHLGGIAGDLAFTRRSGTQEAALLNGRRTPVIAGTLMADVLRVAEQRRVNVRTLIESIIRKHLHGASWHEGLHFTDRLRDRLRLGPADCHTLARDLRVPLTKVTVALRGLRSRGYARYTGPRGSRNRVWVSLEEL